MARRFLSALLFAIVVTGEGTSQPEREEVAQATCKIFDRILEGVGNGFDDYRGKEVGPDIYEAAIWIAPFRQCLIVLADGPMYVCPRLTYLDETQRVYGYALEKARQCLVDWREAPLEEADALGRTKVKGMRLVKNFDSEEISFGIIHTRDKLGGVPLDSVTMIIRLTKQSSVAS